MGTGTSPCKSVPTSRSRTNGPKATRRSNMSEAYIFSAFFVTFCPGFETRMRQSRILSVTFRQEERAMSAIAFEWVRAARQTKGDRPARAVRGPSRQEEFRLALDQYIASYAAAQRHRAGAIDKLAPTRLGSSIAAGFIGSIRSQCRRLLAAVREVWLFS